MLLKTVLHLLSSNKLSGAENVAIDILKNLKKVDVVCFKILI